MPVNSRKNSSVIFIVSTSAGLVVIIFSALFT